MALVPRRFPSVGPPVFFDQAFEEFWARRTAVNRSINALVFSRRLTLHEVSTLRPHLRDRKLGELYPAHVVGERFGYQLRTAETYLRESAEFLFEAAFISCQPAYEHYVDRVAELVSAVTGVAAPDPQASLPAKHTWFKARGADTTGPWLEVFDVLREARNAFVHNGGVVNKRLADQRAALSQGGQDGWKHIAKTEIPPMDVGDPVDIRFLDPVATIYAIGKLAIDLNRRVLAGGIIPGDDRWADLAVLDYRQRNPEGWKVARDLRRRRASGHGTYAFGAAVPALTANPALLRDAADRAPTDVRLP